MDQPAVKGSDPDPFRSSRRNFIIIGHRAVSDGAISLNDLCGASGRWDGIARAITSALFLSHSMRRDTSLHLLLLGPGDPPKILSINGDFVKYLNPDERACSALMRKNLAIDIGQEVGRTVRTSPGIHITRGDLSVILDRTEGVKVLLKEDGSDISLVTDLLANDQDGGKLYCFLSDDMDLQDEELSILEETCALKVSIGPLSLHTNQVITIVHNKLDRWEE